MSEHLSGCDTGFVVPGAGMVPADAVTNEVQHHVLWQ